MESTFKCHCTNSTSTSGAFFCNSCGVGCDRCTLAKAYEAKCTRCHRKGELYCSRCYICPKCNRPLQNRLVSGKAELHCSCGFEWSTKLVKAVGVSETVSKAVRDATSVRFDQLLHSWNWALNYNRVKNNDNIHKREILKVFTPIEVAQIKQGKLELISVTDVAATDTTGSYLLPKPCQLKPEKLTFSCGRCLSVIDKLSLYTPLVFSVWSGNFVYISFINKGHQPQKIQLLRSSEELDMVVLIPMDQIIVLPADTNANLGVNSVAQLTPTCMLPYSDLPNWKGVLVTRPAGIVNELEMVKGDAEIETKIIETAAGFTTIRLCFKENTREFEIDVRTLRQEGSFTLRYSIKK
ncbi:hypothetical protein DAMA08_053610 [Martiniozyma asiatica (nom. inval.)]|nr:hypothetical protein DAMA08_053610 [Martiniozyma asiatica]